MLVLQLLPYRAALPSCAPVPPAHRRAAVPRLHGLQRPAAAGRAPCVCPQRHGRRRSRSSAAVAGAAGAPGAATQEAAEASAWRPSSAPGLRTAALPAAAAAGHVRPGPAAGAVGVWANGRRGPRRGAGGSCAGALSLIGGARALAASVPAACAPQVPGQGAGRTCVRPRGTHAWAS